MMEMMGFTMFHHQNNHWNNQNHHVSWCFSTIFPMVSVGFSHGFPRELPCHPGWKRYLAPRAPMVPGKSWKTWSLRTVTKLGLHSFSQSGRTLWHKKPCIWLADSHM
jgi:hypothetical protein